MKESSDNFQLNQFGFNYQVDLVLTNVETNFKDIQKKLLNQHNFFLLSRIKIGELLTEKFLQTFLKNGELYLNSYDTQLDSHDCVCLLSNGDLVLNIVHDTYERMPFKASREPIKSQFIKKHEVRINILNEKEVKTKRVELERAFSNQLFSFTAFWKSQASDQIAKKYLQAYFGHDRVFDCVNRVETRTFEVASALLGKSDDAIEHWRRTQNLFGALINDIPLEKIFPQIDEANKTKVSILRFKAFSPNKLVSEIIEHVLEAYFDEGEHEPQVFINVHGQRDSPISLLNESQLRAFSPTLYNVIISRVRQNYENILTINITRNDAEKEPTFQYTFTDYDKIFVIS